MPDLAVPRPAPFKRLRIVAFVVYALALVTATHWPKPLLLDAPLHSDKVIHFGAFFVWILLLAWNFTSPRVVPVLVSIALCYAVLDELTQGIPGINRHVTAGDLLANLSGVLLATIVIAIGHRRKPGHRG